MSENQKQTIIAWQEPPKRPVRRFDWQGIVDSCKANPGEWALVAEMILPGHSQTAKRHGLQTRTSRVGKNYAPNLGDLYVRWPK